MYLKKILPLCLCAAVICTTPAMAATKDELNNSLQETQQTQETKQEEIEELQNQLETIDEAKQDITIQIIEMKELENETKKDAAKTINEANAAAINATMNAVTNKKNMITDVTVQAAGIASEEVFLQAKNTEKATSDISEKSEKTEELKEQTEEQIEKLESEISKLEEKESELKDEIAEIEEKEKKEAEEKAAKEAAESKKVYSQSSDGALTKSKGVVYYNGHKETYYSQRVLPGNGLNIPGRHVAEDGTIRDENDYICVAANPSYMSKGSIVETSLGTAKVYDSGCDYGTIDIYTDW